MVFPTAVRNHGHIAEVYVYVVPAAAGMNPMDIHGHKRKETPKR